MSEPYITQREHPQKLTFAQRFGLFFYDRREITVLFCLALITIGILSYGVFMKRQGFPTVDIPVSVVSGTYFVNSPTRMDQDITEPITAAIGELPEVDTATAQASDNFFMVIVEFKEGTSSRSGTDRIKKAIETKARMPKEAVVEYKPIDGTKYAEEFDALISAYQPSGATNLPALEQKTAAIADELQKHEGIVRADVLRQYETGINPSTGQTATEKQHFDRIGFRQNGKTVFHSSVTLGIVGEKDQDALELSEDIDTALAELKSNEAFAGIELRVSADFAEGIEAQISSLQRNLLEGLVVVLLISFLLISWRASLTSAIAMITVMLITIGVLYVTGNTLNTVTLFALILSLGLIVDDTTIKVEAIDAAKREHRRKRSIIALAAKRVSRASTTGTVITMLAFAPMLFVGGILGDFIRILPITIIISLALSLLVSLILVPILSSVIILKGWPKETRNPVLKLEQLISNSLARLLRVGKRSRIRGILIGSIAILISLVMIAASIPLFQELKFDIFPSTKDSDIVQVSLRFSQGTSIAQAEEGADEANLRISKVLGSTFRRLSYQNSGSALEATATIDLTSYEDRTITSPELLERLDNTFVDFPGAEVKVSQIDAGPPVEDLPFRLQIAAKDRAAAQRLAADMVVFLKNRTVTRPNGNAARITQAELITPIQIIRTDGNPIVEVGAGFNADDTSTLVTATRTAVEAEFSASRLSEYNLSENDLAFDFGTESENQESFQTMLIAFPILLLAMYLLMALQFRSYLQPLLIFSAIPYSFFGVAYGLHVTDNPLSFFVLVGFFALIGIAVNNTILLTDYANQARADGQSRIDAIANSIQARFRPLLTTSLTSMVALIPLALSDPFWESLSITLIFGLLSSTFLVIIAFPYVYLFGEGLRMVGSILWHRRLPKAVQYPLDVLIAPVRLVHILVHIVFHHTY